MVYAVIISSVVLLSACLCSSGVKKPLAPTNTHAALIYLPALFLIDIQLFQVDFYLMGLKMSNARRPECAKKLCRVRVNAVQAV